MDKHSLQISAIKVGRRYRQDLGDLAGLAKSIRELGLLHPLVVSKDNDLLCGRRRLEACKELGWTDIPVRVVSIEDPIRAEHDENEVRKNFTFSERMDIGQAVEKLLAKKAKERMLAGKPCEKSTQGRSRDRAAEAAGMSGPTYQSAKTLLSTGLPELVRMVDEEEVSISAAAAIATLPKKEQRKVISKGPEAVGIMAKEIHQAARPFPNGSKSPRQEAATDPGLKWIKVTSALVVHVNSVKRLGGIQELSKDWTADAKRSELQSLTEIRDTLQTWIDFLERSSHAGSTRKKDER